ncbi:MAG: S66 peptidase family protein [Salibacteraceae bacterium]
MNTIPPLKIGDLILIISPAKAIPNKYVELAIQEFESWGLKVEVGLYAKGKHYYFSGKDSERADDLQWALNHPKAKAIVTARGGYGSIRIIDKVDYTMFKRNPKWIVGFSDVTIFHNKLHSEFELPSIHAVAPLYFDRLKSSNKTLTTLKAALFGEEMITKISAYSFNKLGEGEGLLVGGNLAIIASLIGSSLDIETDGKILFLEEVSEYAYRFDRMLWSLKKAGKLDNLEGLIFGGLTDIKESQETFGCDIEELVNDVVSDYNYPVMFNYPAGHQLDNRALVMGQKYVLKVEKNGATVIKS